MNNLLMFVLSFTVSASGTFFVLNKGNTEEYPKEVLALSTEQPVETESPSPTPTQTPTPSSTPKPTPKPTVKPTATPTATPTLTPTPVPTPVEPTSTPDVWSPPAMEGLFAQYAGQYGVDKNLLERIANCESHFNPEARNGDYVGLFQFATSTWINYRSQLGMDTNPSLRTNVEESIRTGAFLVSKRGIAPWPSCI